MAAVAALRAALAAAALLRAGIATAEPADRWAAEIGEASARFEIPRSWIRRVMRFESGGRAVLRGRPTVSRAGAMGLMQLMPGTWTRMRALLGLGWNPYDARDNILAGAAYLRLMYDRFGYPGLFGAYNAGPTRYAAYLAGIRSLPAETKAYVAALAQRATKLPSIVSPSSRSIFAVTESASPVVASIGRQSPSSGAALFVSLTTSWKP